MAGNYLLNWWTKMNPHLRANKELWVGFFITSCLFYKISYGGKKQVKDKPDH